MPAPVERYFVVPHTHWDREWYRPFEHFHVLLAGVVDELLDTLEDDPQFRSFTLDGQAIVLEDYVAIRPGNEQRLRRLIAARRIEIGPSYVLPDEFLVGAEPLVRNLLIGRAVCRQFGGEPSAAGYLPDSFGHPLQLPQILAGFGIDTLLFSRGVGDELDEVGVAFRWAAPDGSRVLAVQLLADYSNFAEIADADDAEARVRGLLDEFGRMLARAGMRAVVLCNGTDHTRVQPQMPRLCAELADRLPGCRFEIAGYGDYVSALRPGALPSWSGELLGGRLQNVLRGVNSARLYLKQANERAEQLLLGVETLTALRVLHAGGRFPVEDFRFAWRELLKCQPHDSICGCSCDEVHRDMLVRYGSLERTLGLLRARAAGGDERADTGGRRMALFNPLPFARSALVAGDGAGPAVVGLAGFEACTIALDPAAATAPRAGDRIQSDRFAVRVAGDGTLVIDEPASGRRFAGMHALEDEADMGDLYNFCPVAADAPRRWVPAGSRILADGPLVWELEIAYRGELPAGLDAGLRPRAESVTVTLTTVVRLVRGRARIEFETAVDNLAADHRLRVVFPVGRAPGPVRAETQFAVARRPLVPPPPRTRWREPPDPTQHAIGVVALGRLALMTRGLPEYEARPAADGSELCLTLLRCVGLLARPGGVLPTRPVHAGPAVPTPEGQCQGRHVLEYALRLDGDALDDVALLQASQDYRTPFLVLPAGADLASPLELDGDVVFSCRKGAEDGGGLVLRVFNPQTRPAAVRVRGPVAAERVALDETGGAPLTAGLVDVRPGEIATLRLRPAPAGAR